MYIHCIKMVFYILAVVELFFVNYTLAGGLFGREVLVVPQIRFAQRNFGPSGNTS